MKIWKKCLAMLLAVAMLLMQMPAAFAAEADDTISIDLATVSAGGTGYTYAGGVLTITDSGSYILTGTTSTNRVVVSAASDITLNGASITSAAGNSPFTISVGSTANLTLLSANTLTGGNGAAGLHVPATAAVVINGTGTLTATGGVATNGTSNGAGIGGMGANGNAGSITVKGGTVNATGGPYAAGIGGGNNNNGTAAGSGGNITISGGIMNATGNNHSSAIGGGCRGNGGNITISGGTVTANAGTYSAAIGGGFVGGAGNILISGGMVTATGKNSAPGIGRDPGADITDPLISGGTTSKITISGGTVIATGEGKPGVGNSGGTDPTTLSISGGSVKSSPLPLNTVTDGGSTPVYPATVSVQMSSGVLANTAVSCTAGGAAFSAETDSSGKLYLWLPAGMANLTVTAGGVDYEASGTVLSDGTTTLTAKSNTPPARRSGIPGTASVRLLVNNQYTLNLASIFEDTDGGPLTYTVSVNGGTAQAASQNYTYTPAAEGTTTLEFTANDGKADSADTYTVTLIATNTPPENTPPSRRSSVPATAEAGAVVNSSYILNLATIFEDIDGDPMTYTVSVNGGPAQAASPNYTYIPAVEGTTTLSFTANDGKADSADTYAVTLRVTSEVIDLSTVSTGGTGYTLTTITVNSLPERVLTITAPGSYILTGTVKQGPSAQPGNPLHVEVTAATANIVLSNASISVFNHSPLYIKSGSTVSLTLADGTTNQLRSVVTTNAGTGSESISISGVGVAGLHVPVGAAVIIDGTGTLNAMGGAGGSGIGGSINQYASGYDANAGSITINGGTVTAIGGEGGGAGIGGGDRGNGGIIIINGGTIVAKGGELAAGIGGGSSLPPIITGGSVKAIRISPEPTNGSAAVYLTTVTVKGPSGILADTPVSCTVGGTAFLAQTDSSGKLYLWLPQGAANLVITAGGVNYLVGGNILSDGTTALTAWQETPPARRPGIPAEAAASVEINRPYALKLTTIFEDANNDPMTYTVSVNGGTAQPANADYTYTPAVEGTTTLRFTANDGKADSVDTYTVTLTTALAGTIDLSTVSADGTGYTYADNTVTITAPGSYILTGTTDAEHVVVTAAEADITLRNVSIAPPGSASLAVSPNSSLSLTLEGTNTLTGAAGCAGLHVPVSAAVVIEGTGSLTAKGGACSGSSNGAGIGGMGAGGNAGSITINGGTVAATGGPYAAGIGGGNNYNGTDGGTGGTITISGGTVNANGNDHSPGIGGGCRGDGGNITISGGIVTANAGSWSAAIGGGFTGNTGSISITGGKVTATGRDVAPGIGRAPGKDGGGSILVSGGTVVAKGGHSACPGIGSWRDILLDNDYTHDGTTLTVTGGSVNSSPMPYSGNVTYNGSVTAYPATVTVQGSSGILSNTELSCKVGGNSFYAETDDSGKLYLWLPRGRADLTLTAGGIDYRASGPVLDQGITELTARPNTPPVRRDGIPDTASVRLAVNAPYTVNLADIFYDADGDPLTYTVSMNGEPAQAASMNYAYTPVSVGQTSLTFKANDGMAYSTDTCTVIIIAANTQPKNTPPGRRSGIPAEAAASVAVNTPYTVNLASIFEDADGDPMIYTVSVNGADPVVTVADYVYTPAAAGNIMLVFKANDGMADSTDTYTVALTARNTPPVRRPGIPDTTRVRLEVNNPYTVNLANIFYDADSDPLTYTVSVNSANPVVTVADYVYTPVSAGNIMLVFMANDGESDSTDTYTVAITATDTPPENTPPARRAGVPEEAAAGVAVNTPYTLDLTNIFEDADGDPMIYTVSVNGADPVVTVADYVYTPVAAGDILLVFKANDGMADSIDTYTVRLTADAAPPRTYALNITAGTGGRITAGTNGNYEAGTVINIAAAASTNYSFNKWTSTGGGSFDSTTRAGTTFTMPANAATITAIFKYDDRDDSDEDRDHRKHRSDTPAYTASVKTTDATGNSILDTTLPIAVDQNTGSASLDIGSQQGNIITNGGTAVITVPSIPGVTAYTLGIPVAYLSTLNGQGMLTFNTDTGSVTLPANMLAGVAGAEGKKAEITIGQGDKSTLSEEAKAAIGDRPLIQLTVTIDGKQTEWNNPNALVTVSIPYTHTAAELANPESIVIWYIDGSGKAVSVPNGRYDAATGTVTFSTTHFSDYAVAYNKVSFNDVAAGAWYNKAVSFISAREITSGTGNGNYSPEAKLTRGEFIVLMMRAYGIAPDMNPADNFSDAGNTYYTGYLAAAKRLGITAGVGNNMYAPGKQITRQEMFTLLYNALKAIGRLPEDKEDRDLTAFSDAGDIASWAKDAMTLLVKTGTVGGNGGKLSATATTTRVEMAQVLYNLLSK